jgi:hypothetical protein
MMAGALSVALLTSTGAFAQVPPDPNNPNEAVPDALNVVPYGEPINLATAKRSRTRRPPRSPSAIGTMRTASPSFLRRANSSTS